MLNSTNTDIQVNDESITLSIEQYVAFIEQVQLERIWLKSLKVTNSSGGNTPPGASVTLDESQSWKDSESGFQAFHKYTAEFRSDKNRKLARVDVEFGLDYRSEEPMNDEVFEVFSENNLPLNSWPYFRETLSSAVARMGWLPFTLPARKIMGSASQRNKSQ